MDFLIDSQRIYQNEKDKKLDSKLKEEMLFRISHPPITEDKSTTINEQKTVLIGIRTMISSVRDEEKETKQNNSKKIDDLNELEDIIIKMQESSCKTSIQNLQQHEVKKKVRGAHKKTQQPNQQITQEMSLQKLIDPIKAKPLQKIQNELDKNTDVVTDNILKKFNKDLFISDKQENDKINSSTHAIVLYNKGISLINDLNYMTQNHKEGQGEYKINFVNKVKGDIRKHKEN